MNPDLLPLLFGGSLGGWLGRALMNRQPSVNMGGPITDADAAALRAEQTPISALSQGPGYAQLNLDRENQGMVPVSPGYYANVYLPQGPRQDPGFNMMNRTYNQLTSGNPYQTYLGVSNAPFALGAGSLSAAYQDSLFNPVRRRQVLGF